MKFNDPAVIVFIGVVFSIVGVLLGGVGAFRATRQQAQEQAELKNKSDEIAALYQKIAESQIELRAKADIQTEAQGQLRQKSEEISALNKEIANTQIDLRRRSDEIAELNKTISATVTGGDSYCYFLVGHPSNKTNSVDLMLMTEGKYPLYDVSIKIDDVEKLLNIVMTQTENGNRPFQSMTEANTFMLQASRVIKVGNIGPSQAMELGSLQLPDTDKQSFNISILARNGYVFQIVRFRRVKGEWKRAIQVHHNGKNVHETIDAEFPRNADGKIQW